MKNAFINTDGVLVSFGYAEANGEDTRIQVPDDFDMPIGSTVYADGKWSARVNTTQAAALARAKRDALLAATDWTQLPDVAEAVRTKWAPYRQALRNVPAQSSFPGAVTWPLLPS